MKMDDISSFLFGPELQVYAIIAILTFSFAFCQTAKLLRHNDSEMIKFRFVIIVALLFIYLSAFMSHFVPGLFINAKEFKWYQRPIICTMGLYFYLESLSELRKFKK